MTVPENQLSFPGYPVSGLQQHLSRGSQQMRLSIVNAHCLKNCVKLFLQTRQASVPSDLKALFFVF
jgi:hypothetical protein